MVGAQDLHAVPASVAVHTQSPEEQTCRNPEMHHPELQDVWERIRLLFDPRATACLVSPISVVSFPNEVLPGKSGVRRSAKG